jgi:hypothetical protein
MRHQCKLGVEHGKAGTTSERRREIINEIQSLRTLRDDLIAEWRKDVYYKNRMASLSFFCCSGIFPAFGVHNASSRNYVQLPVGRVAPAILAEGYLSRPGRRSDPAAGTHCTAPQE